jgi:hypothetical protein
MKNLMKKLSILALSLSLFGLLLIPNERPAEAQTPYAVCCAGCGAACILTAETGPGYAGCVILCIEFECSQYLNQC